MNSRSLLLVFLVLCLTRGVPVFGNPSKAVSRADEIVERSPFGFHPAAVIPPTDYGLATPYHFAIEAGIKWDRSLNFVWHLMESADEVASSSSGDVHIRWVHDRHIRDVPIGIRLLGNIYIGASSGPGSEDYERFAHKGSFLPLSPERYVTFVKAVVERYDGDGVDDMPGLRSPIKFWQVDNEPPHGLKDYARFLELTYDAIKQADPDAKVLMGGVPGMAPVTDYLEEFDRQFVPILDDLAKSKRVSFDVFDIHYFGQANGDYRGISQILNHVKDALMERDLLPEHGFWLCETGTYSGDPIAIRELRNIDYPLQTEQDQACDLIKRHVFSLSLGFRKVFWAYGLVEGFKFDEGFFDFTGLIYDGKYGNDRGKGVRKLAFYSYRKMIETLEGSDWETGERLPDQRDFQVFRFRKPNEDVFVVWSDSIPSEGRIESLELGRTPNLVKLIEAVPDVPVGQAVNDYSTAFKETFVQPHAGKITIFATNKPLYIVIENLRPPFSPQHIAEAMQRFLEEHAGQGFHLSRNQMNQPVIRDSRGDIVPLEMILPREGPPPHHIEAAIRQFFHRESCLGNAPSMTRDDQGRLLLRDRTGAVVPLDIILRSYDPRFKANIPTQGPPPAASGIGGVRSGGASPAESPEDAVDGVE